MNRIAIVIDKELKKKFIKACDGRTITHVLTKLIEEFVKGSKSKDGEHN